MSDLRNNPELFCQILNHEINMAQEFLAGMDRPSNNQNQGESVQMEVETAGENQDAEMPDLFEIANMDEGQDQNLEVAQDAAQIEEDPYAGMPVLSPQVPWPPVAPGENDVAAVRHVPVVEENPAAVLVRADPLPVSPMAATDDVDIQVVHWALATQKGQKPTSSNKSSVAPLDDDVIIISDDDDDDCMVVKVVEVSPKASSSGIATPPPPQPQLLKGYYDRYQKDDRPSTHRPAPYLSGLGSYGKNLDGLPAWREWAKKEEERAKKDADGPSQNLRSSNKVQE